MNEAYGNLWDLAKPPDLLVITTNGTIKANGAAVMGRGIAREAMIRFPSLPLALGAMIAHYGNHVTYHWIADRELLTMPVKHNWWEEADPKLIERSAEELVRFADNAPYQRSIRIWLPRPGCGNGRLRWQDVRPIIAPILDGRFTVVTFFERNAS